MDTNWICENCGLGFHVKPSQSNRCKPRWCSVHCRRGGPTKEISFWSKVKIGDGCWEWARSKNQLGYGLFTYGGKSTRAHRVSYELKHGSIPHGLCVLHKCDNPSCVRPDHLFSGTKKDNTFDMLAKGRHSHGEKHSKTLNGPVGEAHPSSKLTRDNVLEIRGRIVYEPASRLAKDFGVSISGIRAVVNYLTWKHV